MSRNVHSIEDQLILDEGKRASAYQDKYGYWTVGIGTCIDARLGCGLSDEEQLYLLRNRVADRTLAINQQWPWTVELDEVRMGVLINMSYQMGMHGLADFKQFLSAMQRRDFAAAKTAMLDSTWAKTQDSPRAERLALQVETGLWQ